MEEKKRKFKKVPIEVPVDQLTPLDITCGSTKCEDELHCFRMSNKDIKKQGRSGVCKECGADLIDWNRMHKQDIQDAEFVFNSMKNELIRHVYWHTPIDDRAIEKAQKMDKNAQAEHARKILKQRIGKENNYMEGRQTPMVGNEIVSYAQHATGTCCRRCLEYWHNIPTGVGLSEDQLDYCVELVLRYIEERVPEHVQ